MVVGLVVATNSRVVVQGMAVLLLLVAVMMQVVLRPVSCEVSLLVWQDHGHMFCRLACSVHKYQHNKCNPHAWM